MDDKLVRTAGLICDINALLISTTEISKQYKQSGSMSEKSDESNSTKRIISRAQNHLAWDTESILNLVSRKNKTVLNLGADIDYKWKQCDYILHALLFVLKDAEPMNILKNMSKDNVAFVKDAISIVKSYKCPDAIEIDVAQKLFTEYYRKNGKPGLSEYKKAENNIIRFSANITKLIAENWDAAVAEIDKWSNELGIEHQNTKSAVVAQETKSKASSAKPVVHVARQSVAGTAPVAAVPTELKHGENKMITIAELAKKMGYKDAGVFYCSRNQYLRKHPDDREVIGKWFVVTVEGGIKRAFFDEQHFDELVKMMRPARAKAAKNTNKKSRGSKKTVANNEDLVVDNASVSDGVTDMTGVIALKTYLAQIQKLYDDLEQEHQNAVQHYEELKQQTKQAEDNLNKLRVRLDTLHENLVDTNGLMQRYDNATQSLKNAEENMIDTKNKINQFLRQQQCQR